MCFIIEVCEVFRKALLCISYLPDAMGFCYFSLGVYNNVGMNISFTSYHELNYIRSRFDFTEHSKEDNHYESNDTVLFVWLKDDGITTISYLGAMDYSLVAYIVDIFILLPGKGVCSRL